MPTYDYKCSNCNETMEIHQSIHEDPLTALEGCSSNDGIHSLSKVISRNIGIAFKGGGFYANDTRTSKADSTPSSSDTSSKTGSSETTSTSASPKSDSVPKTD